MQQALHLTDYASFDVEIQRTAAGGFGVVHMGPCKQLNGDWVALKTMRPEILARSPRVRELFIREALTWIGLWPHPNVLTALAVTVMNSQPYLVLEYAHKGNLRSWLGKDVSLTMRLEWAQHIAVGLDEIHTPDAGLARLQPIVHRDLKPENILISQQDRAMITDFGLAKVVQQYEEVLSQLAAESHYTGNPTQSTLLQTARGAAIGTAAYMAPEQWEDAANAGPPADIYAFGLILSELLAGRHAYFDLGKRQTIDAWRQAHLYHIPQNLHDRVPELSGDLEEMYWACLAKRPEQRPSATEALAALRRAAQRLGQQPYYPKELLKRTPEWESVKWYTCAGAYLRLGLRSEALELSKRAIELTPRDPHALLTHGVILAETLQGAEALEAYQAALEVCPREDHSTLRLLFGNIGNVFAMYKQCSDADEAYSQALALAPDSAEMWCNRATNQWIWGTKEAQDGHRSEALQHLEQGIYFTVQALSLNPREPKYVRLLQNIRDELAKQINGDSGSITS